MAGPVFAGSSHVTRTLSVEPGIPATLGAPGADGCSGRSVTSMVTDLAATLLFFLCPSFTFTVSECSSLSSWLRGDLVRICPALVMVKESLPGPSRV